MTSNTVKTAVKNAVAVNGDTLVERAKALKPEVQEAIVAVDTLVTGIANAYSAKHKAILGIESAKLGESLSNEQAAAWFTANIGENWHKLDARSLNSNLEQEAKKKEISVPKAALFLQIRNELLQPAILKALKDLRKDKDCKDSLQPPEELAKLAQGYFDSCMQQMRDFASGRAAKRANDKAKKREAAKAAKTAAEKDPLGNWRTRVNGLHSEFNNLVDKEGLAGLDKMRSVHAEVTAHFQAIIKLTL